MHRIFRSKASKLAYQSMLAEATIVCVYFKSTNNIKRSEWMPVTVMEAKYHLVIYKRSQKGL